MKQKTTLFYWIFTVLFAGLMTWSALPGVNPQGEALQFMHDYLGYPVYFIQFISVAKLAGCLAILVPGFNKIKEWAYAGLFFDLAGAIFSIVAVQQKFEAGTLFIVLPVVLGALSYYFWTRRKMLA
ncbi:MAG: DoxX family protein [Sphingobacteriales bacterium]|nr:DoxX family protein [Sphingobacteriales bacterium]